MLSTWRYWAVGVVAALVCVVWSASRAARPEEWDSCRLDEGTRRAIAVTVEAESGLLPGGTELAWRDSGGGLNVMPLADGVARDVRYVPAPSRSTSLRSNGRPSAGHHVSQSGDTVTVLLLAPPGWRAEPSEAELGALPATYRMRVVPGHE